jgi:hypothetical protein
MIWAITIREIEEVAAVREQRFAPDTSRFREQERRRMALLRLRPSLTTTY